jgi:rubrerythrin
MTELNPNTLTAQNLKEALTWNALANRLYLYMAAKADVEGHAELSAIFRSTAEGETGHAHGHMEYLEQVGDPLVGAPFGPSSSNIATAIAAENTHVEKLRGYAEVARSEGFTEIADWFEMLAKADAAHSKRFAAIRDKLTPS